MAIGRRELHHRDVQRHGAAREEIWNVGQEDRDEIGAALLNRFAHRRSIEQRDRSEAPFTLGFTPRRGTICMQMEQSDAFDVRTRRQSVEQWTGRRGSAMAEDAHPARDDGDGVFWRDGA